MNDFFFKKRHNADTMLCYYGTYKQMKRTNI